MTKHTGLTVELYANCPPEILDDRGDLVATVHYGGGRSEVEVHANARLFAAAPLLLEALKGVLRVADRNTVEFDAARDAVASAEGRNP